MSFILDALRKSETDRQRQSGPALFEVKVAAPRTALPSWAMAIGALLLVNLGIVMWMSLRHSVARTPDTVPPRPAAAAPAPPAPAPATLTPSRETLSPPAPAPRPALAGIPRAADGAAADGDAAPGTANPDDYTKALDPSAPVTSANLGPHVRRGTADGVPLYLQAAGADARLPQLRLDLHVFAPRPQDRFVMINMHRLREGDSLPEGVRVESITPDGAVLSFNGTSFLLPRQ
ncbi:MAG TPA: general secretion pathway protein GspB [Steroidobacteraceae bacterium]|jgi:general secretion pathway protein B|nr:general secretion pathway protein GspB [Steroidobacteraceae bacterium]